MPFLVFKHIHGISRWSSWDSQVTPHFYFTPWVHYSVILSYFLSFSIPVVFSAVFSFLPFTTGRTGEGALKKPKGSVCPSSTPPYWIFPPFQDVGPSPPQSWMPAMCCNAIALQHNSKGEKNGTAQQQEAEEGAHLGGKVMVMSRKFGSTHW